LSASALALASGKDRILTANPIRLNASVYMRLHHLKAKSVSGRFMARTIVFSGDATARLSAFPD